MWPGGSAIAKSMLTDGHEVSVLDEDPEAIALLNQGRDESWEDLGGPSPSVPRSRSTRSPGGHPGADAFVASTDGDNTNLVIAQIAKRRFEVERVVVRVLDPDAPLVRRTGPADRLPDPDGDRAARGGGARRISFEGIPS